ILRGSASKVEEAGAVVVGGHSIDDQEPKFGLSVTGLVHPKKYFENSGAKPGDKLVLTKPIGVGIQTTAIKRNKLSDQQLKLVTEVMSTLNKDAAEALAPFHPRAVTDITGFGLLGHAFEMAEGSQVSLNIEVSEVPTLAGSKELAEEKIVPGGSKANHKWLQDHVHYADEISLAQQLILADAITS